MPQIVVVYWRDIPAQVIASAGRRDQVKIPLSARFQEAIDAAAMRGGVQGADAYLNDWRKGSPVECGTDLATEAQALASRLEGEYDQARLRGLVKAAGQLSG